MCLLEEEERKKRLRLLINGLSRYGLPPKIARDVKKQCSTKACRPVISFFLRERADYFDPGLFS